MTIEMTQSIKKAKDGFIKVVIDGVEGYIDPKHLKINNLTIEKHLSLLNDNQVKYSNAITELTNSIKSLNETIQKYDGDVAVLKKELKDLHAIFENAIRGFISQ